MRRWIQKDCHSLKVHYEAASSQSLGVRLRRLVQPLGWIKQNCNWPSWGWYFRCVTSPSDATTAAVEKQITADILGVTQSDVHIAVAGSCFENVLEG